MQSHPLITPQLMLIQLGLVVLFILYSFIFSPPVSQYPDIPHKPLTQEKMDQLQGTQSPQEFLISERRPGLLDHRRFFVKDGRIWGQLTSQWSNEKKNPKEDVQQWNALLTLDPQFQKIAQRRLKVSRAAVGTIAMIDLKKKQIVGLSEYIDPQHPTTRQLKINRDVHLALRAIAPAAGLFRIVSTAALLESGMNPVQKFCYHKTKQSIRPDYLNLVSSHLTTSRHDCSTLDEAFAETELGFFIPTTHQFLQADDLITMARTLGFDQEIPYFELPHELSTAHVPNTDIRRAYTALGLKNSRANTLHGAMIAAAIADNGTLYRPQLAYKIVNHEGKEISAPELQTMATGMKPNTAKRMSHMMRRAIQAKTTYSVFKNWPSSLNHYRVAGQSSTKTIKKPSFIRYTWFVGFAPADRPRWAFAVMVINNKNWYVRALDIAHRVLRDYFEHLHSKGKLY